MNIGLAAQQARMKAVAQQRAEQEEYFMDDYGDDYDEEDYGSQSQNQFYYEDPANAAMIDGSGSAYDDEEDISDESGQLIKQHIQQQMLAQAAAKKANMKGFAQMTGQGTSASAKPGFITGASTGYGVDAAKKQNLLSMAAAQQKPQNKGGFNYGIASAAGGAASLFGDGASQGAFQSGIIGQSSSKYGQQMKKPTGGIVFGQASQFGGAGNLFGPSSGGDLGIGAGSSAQDDPYNIPIDLTKIKRTAQPPKTFEEKTSDEKIKTMQQMGKEFEKTGAKSIMKKSTESGVSKQKKANVSFGQCLIYEYDKDPESNQIAIKVDSKDISDMRDEKTKIRDLLQEKENEQLAQIKKQQALMNKYMIDSKDDNKDKQDQFKSSSKEANKVDDSIGESQSLSQTKSGKNGDKHTESYDTDTFEEQSASHSKSLSVEGSAKKGINYWPGKNAFESSNASNSASKDQSSKAEVFSANAMEEYLKKQANKQAKPAIVTSKNTQQDSGKKSNSIQKDISESSDKYTDDDFDFISRSQSKMMDFPRIVKPQQVQPSSFHQQQKKDPISSKIQTQYVKKQNQFSQTETGKYSFMSKDEGGYTGNSREWTLQRNLEEAEIQLQDQRHQIASDQDEINEIKEKLKKAEMEQRAAKRESMNQNETNSRLKEQLKEYMHKINLYKIETEELIKQIDLADSKNRELEDELKLQEAEFEKKMQLQLDRIMMRRSKNEERGTYELKRKHNLETDEFKSKIDEMNEEIDYFKQKIDKLEVENSQMRMGKGDNKKMRELENEVEFLKAQIQDDQKYGGNQLQQNQTKFDSRMLKSNLTPEEQIQIQKELQQLDMIIKSYQEDNQKATRKIKDLEGQIKNIQQIRELDQKQIKEYQLKALKDKNGVFVEECENEDKNIQALNVMGASQSISQKQLNELYEKLKNLQESNETSKRDIINQGNQLKAQMQKLREEKDNALKQLLDAEFVLGNKDNEITQIQKEKNLLVQSYEETVKELKEKLNWFRDNQKLLSQDESEQKQNFKEIQDLKEQLVKYKEDKKRFAELEKKCKLLEETIKSKNPNSIGMLIQAAKSDVNDDIRSESKKELQAKVDRITFEMEFQEKEFEKKLRTMRQEQERIKKMYEERQGNGGESKLVKQLEEELQKTKNYYNKRIREIEDKYKFGNTAPKIPKQQKSTDFNQKSQRSISSTGQAKQKYEDNEVEQLKDQIERITKERNILAQKLVNSEGAKNELRRNSQRSEQITRIQTESPVNQDLKNVFYQGEKIENQSKQDTPSKNSFISQDDNQSLNPFQLKNKSQEKSIKKILQLLKNGNLKQYFGQKKQVKINDFYKSLTGEIGIDLNINDVKVLKKFLENKYLDENNMQDKDYEFLEKDDNTIDIQFLMQILQKEGNSNIQDNKKIECLENEVKRLKQMLSEDNDYLMNKNQKIQRDISQVENEKRELQQKIVKLEAQKSRLEDIFKASMKGSTMDLIDQVQLMARRIEYLEEQSQQRAKSQYLENQEPFIREIEMLKSKLTQEREMRDQLLLKKNAEVSYFKAELDALLSEMQNQIKKKQASNVY